MQQQKRQAKRPQASETPKMDEAAPSDKVVSLDVGSGRDQA